MTRRVAPAHWDLRSDNALQIERKELTGCFLMRESSCGVKAMLVLSRKPGERILIGDNVTVTIVRIGLNTVRLGIEAPRELNIVREELYINIPSENTADNASSPADQSQPSV